MFGRATPCQQGLLFAVESLSWVFLSLVGKRFHPVFSRTFPDQCPPSPILRIPPRCGPFPPIYLLPYAYTCRRGFAAVLWDPFSLKYLSLNGTGIQRSYFCPCARRCVFRLSQIFFISGNLQFFPIIVLFFVPFSGTFSDCRCFFK